MAKLDKNMSKMVRSHVALLTGTVSTPLGRVMLAGRHEWGRGSAPRGRWRVYGSYAIVFVTGGSGVYRDAAGLRTEIATGDAIFVFPELAHWYGPRTPRERWDEIYVTFDGPLFETLRESGLLAVTRPVRRLGETGRKLASRLETWVTEFGAPSSVERRTILLASLMEIVLEALGTGESADVPTPWLDLATTLLETDFSQARSVAEVAAALEMPYETFRKRFTEAVGVSPARYRLDRRIDAARQLLRFFPQVTNRQAAESLGFADEFHFSKRFTEKVGVTPQAFRRGGDSGLNAMNRV